MKITDKRRFQNYILSDNGSTLITVIVAISFVTILVTIILGTTLVNVRMKGIDKRTKDDFYYAEKALNDIYTGLGQELAVKAADRYEEAFEKVGDDVDFNLAEKAEEEYRQNFAKDAHDLLPTTPSDIAAKLNEYITSNARDESVDKVAGVEYQKNGINISGESYPEKKADRIVIKGVQVSAKDSSEYRAVITTDIVIGIPTVDFLGTNADVSDYGIIADKGLYIEGTNSDTTIINGNVYAGIHSTPFIDADSNDVDSKYAEITDAFSRKNFYGGINIYSTNVELKGNYVISKGDINLAGTNPTLKVYLDSAGSNLTNLWFTSLRTLKSATIDAAPGKPPLTTATIDINANTFALNDLALNADNSSAKFKGNYYGYNDNTLADSLGILGEVSGRDDTKSSAIVINGNRASLDMGGIDTFVLMGKAYIDFTSDTTGTDPSGTPKQVVPTSEGVAIKTNQQLYLVPPDFLDGPNPAVGGKPGTSEEITFTINSTLSDDWFGSKYLDYGEGSTPDPTKIHTVFSVKQKKNNPSDPDVWVYYDYLNFNNKVWEPTFGLDGKINGYKNTPSDIELGTGGSISSKQKFFYDIMTATTDSESDAQPSAWRLKQRIDLSTVNTSYFDLKGCAIGSTSSDAHFYAKNAVVNYERVNDTTIQSNVKGNTDGMFRYAKYPQHLFRRYKWLCTKLNGKEDVPYGEVASHDETPIAGELPDITDNREWTEEWPEEWETETDKDKMKVPLRHFVKLANVKTGINNYNNTLTADSKGLKPGAFGTVIVKRMPASSPTLVLKGSTDGSTDVPAQAINASTFKGVVIVDGNIEVPAGMNVNGLLMATGTITLKGNNKIHYDKGLIQSRIEKEMNIIKNLQPSDADYAEPYKEYYLINYLADDSSGTAKLIYEVAPGTKIKRDRIEADYNEFMYYENWQKGEQ